LKLREDGHLIFVSTWL